MSDPEGHLQDELAQVGVLGEVADTRLHIGRIDRDRLAALVGGIEGNLVEHPLNHGLQPARADVLDRGVDLGGDARQRVDGVVREPKSDAFRRHQGDVLLDEARLRLNQDAAEVLLGERLELDADRQPALQLGQQVRGLGHVESPRGDE